MLDELLPVSLAVEVLADGERIVIRVEQLGRLAVESQHVAEHAVKRRAEQVRSLGEQTVERTALVLHAALLTANAEAHVGVLGGYFQLPKQSDEVRVGAMVEDHESRVDVVHIAERLGPHRVRVAAQVVIGLEKLTS